MDASQESRRWQSPPKDMCQKPNQNHNTKPTHYYCCLFLSNGNSWTWQGGDGVLEHKAIEDKNSDAKSSLTFDFYWSFRGSSNYSHPEKSQQPNTYDGTWTDEKSQTKEQGR